jgi:UDP-N-acetylglucosamine:LPS N-acetylglucosamine transferase
LENKKILLIASSGGHLSQLLAVSDKLNKDSLIVITNNMDAIIYKYSIKSKKIKTVDTTTNVLFHFYNFLIAIFVMIRFSVSGVVTTGGPMVLPFLLLARMLRKKILYIDTMSRVEDLSNTGKFVFKWKLYSEFYVQWPALAEKYEGTKYEGQIFNFCNSRHA